jgi:hypothetical protein
LTAEKLLAWGTKMLPKHLVDLAWIHREHPQLDHSHIRSLVVEKFVREKHEARYGQLGIRSVDDLFDRVLDDVRLDQAVPADWSSSIAEDLLFLPGERARVAETLTNGAFVRERSMSFAQSVRESA